MTAKIIQIYILLLENEPPGYHFLQNLYILLRGVQIKKMKQNRARAQKHNTSVYSLFVTQIHHS